MRDFNCDSFSMSAISDSSCFRDEFTDEELTSSDYDEVNHDLVDDEGNIEHILWEGY